MNGRKRRALTETKGYMPGLDGLRALAVLAVIIYHQNLNWGQGGLLGVTLFFVLSGYLITGILMRQWENSGKIDLKDFWLRRARRLLPALFLLLAGVGLWLALWDMERLVSIKQEILAAIFYVNNWYEVFHEVSYFESFGPPSPLGHLWSLAVEEQFYLLWPLLLGLGLRFFGKSKWLTGGTIALALVSALAMTMTYTPGLDPSRVYYGTDTRAFSLLIGAALAMILPREKMKEELAGRNKVILEGVGVLALLVVLVMMVGVNPYKPFLYQGGLLAFSVAAACLVAVLAHPASFLARVFSWRPLRWIGETSYGIYLWHYPVIILTDPFINRNGFNLSLTLMQIVITLILATLSRYLVEEPIRYGIRQRTRRRSRVQWWQRPSHYSMRITLSLSLIILLVFVAPTDGWRTSAKAVASNPQVSEKGQNPCQDSDNIQTPGKTQGTGEIESSENGQTSGEQPTGDVQFPGAENTPNDEQKEITLIGDSVVINVEPVLKEVFPGIVVDAQLGRQMVQAGEVIAQLKEEGKLGQIVILELGSNGPFTDKQLIQILDSLEGCEQIFLINTRVPKPWEAEVNETLLRVTQSYPRTQLVDWYAVSNGHPEYFYTDGVHLTQEGIEAYGKMLIELLKGSSDL